MNFQPQTYHQLLSHGETNNFKAQSLSTNLKVDECSNKKFPNPFGHKNTNSSTWFLPEPQAQTQNESHKVELSTKRYSQHFSFSSDQNEFANQNIKHSNGSGQLFFSNEIKEESKNPFSKSCYNHLNSDKPYEKSKNLFALEGNFNEKPTEKISEKNLFNQNSQNIFKKPNIFTTEPNVPKENNFNNPKCCNNLFNNSFDKKEILSEKRNPFEQLKKEEAEELSMNHVNNMKNKEGFQYEQKMQELNRTEDRIGKMEERLNQQESENESLKMLIMEMKTEMIKKEKELTERISELEKIVNNQIEKENSVSQAEKLTKYEEQGTSSDWVSVCSSCESVESEQESRKKKQKKQNKKTREYEKVKETYLNDLMEILTLKDEKDRKTQICDSDAVKELETRLNKKLHENSQKLICYLEEKFEDSDDKMENILEILKMNCMKKTNKIIKNPFCYE